MTSVWHVPRRYRSAEEELCHLSAQELVDNAQEPRRGRILGERELPRLACRRERDSADDASFAVRLDDDWYGSHETPPRGVDHRVFLDGYPVGDGGGGHPAAVYMEWAAYDRIGLLVCVIGTYPVHDLPPRVIDSPEAEAEAMGREVDGRLFGGADPADILESLPQPRRGVALSLGERAGLRWAQQGGQRAVALYVWNTRMSAAIFETIAHAEVLLQNVIDAQFLPVPPRRRSIVHLSAGLFLTFPVRRDGR
jgi:hypothetical protein